MPKILLVEDNKSNQDLLYRLERTGDRAIRQSRRFANVASDGAGVTKTQAAPSQIPKSSIENFCNEPKQSSPAHPHGIPPP